ncbi:Long chain acyl-CoA synthetase 8 [Thelohanellus kitauei]|uniref:long-chain-fatty-acid--CoA ligase n=1 Tax=Thelohanellus kitauei TaxID=669202 RepID=A0A0C2MM80_THEKT|nr:Long chain acyl-CoA synthetase 8 [Thelohanellus kitauei]
MDQRCEKFVDIEQFTFFEKFYSMTFKGLASLLTYLEALLGSDPRSSASKKRGKFAKQVSGTPKKGDIDVQSCYYEENGERIYRRRGCENGLRTTYRGMETIPQIFKDVALSNKDKRLMGSRTVLTECKSEDQKKVSLELGPFEWLTYAQVYDRISSVASYLHHCGVVARDNVVIFADTSADWLIMALAILFLRATVVTIFPSLIDDYVKFCIHSTEPKCIMVDRKSCPRIDKMLSELITIQTIIYSTTYKDFQLPTLIDFKGNFVNIDDIYQENSQNFLEKLEPSRPDDLTFIMFTSGSTGTPKGVMLTQSNIVAALEGVDYGNYLQDQVYPAYLPLSHIFEICIELRAIFSCCQIGYCNPGTLFDTSPMLGVNTKSDLSLLKPTRMAAVPLILDRIKKNFLLKLKKMPRHKRIMFQTLYNLKASFFCRYYSTRMIDRLFSKKFLQIFGGRLELILSAGSYLPRSTQEFINIVFCHTSQGYGATETCCGGTICALDDQTFGTTGAPFACSEIKLVPWPEGGYSESGVNIKKGELLISGAAVSLGYYKNKEQTEESFEIDPVTQKTWFRTCDIAEILDDLTFRIVGRKSEVIKLSHGEFVQLVPIETTICSSKYVDFVCLIPDNSMQYLIAILCLNVDNLKELAVSLSISESNRDLETLAKKEIVTDTIRADILEKLEKNSLLNKHHRPEKYLFIADPWTPDNGCLTPSLKVRRFKVIQKYSDIISKC